MAGHGSAPSPSSPADRRREAAVAGHRGDAHLLESYREDADPVVRATALGALERCDRLSDDHLRYALIDPDPKVRSRAAELAAARPAVDLVPVLQDESPTVVEMAAWACGERPTPGPAVVDALAAVATDHPDPLCREAAAAALGAIGHPNGLPAILAATEDKVTVRRRAILALAPFEGPAVDAALARASHDRDWQVRQGAEDLLGG